MATGRWRGHLRRVGSGAWTVVPALLAACVLLGVAVAVVAMFTVDGDWPAAGGYVAALSGVALGVVEAGRLGAVLVNRLRGRGEDGWRSLAGWLAETPFVAVELLFLALVAFVASLAQGEPAGVGLGMSLVLFGAISLLAALPLAILVLGRVGHRYVA